MKISVGGIAGYILLISLSVYPLNKITIVYSKVKNKIITKHIRSGYYASETFEASGGNEGKIA